MNRTKRAFLSMTIISTFFCITVLFNIQLPFYSVKGSSATLDDTVLTESGAVKEDAQEAVIHSFKVNQAKIFSAEQYLASDQMLLAQEEAADTQTSIMSATAATPTPATVTEVPLNPSASANLTAAADTAITAAPDQTATEQGASDQTTSDQTTSDQATTDQTVSAQDSSSVATAAEVEEVQPEALYSDIGISIAKDYVNIRKEASTNGEVLGKLYRGSACTIIKTEDEWYYVESGSVTGYAKAEYIKAGIPDDELIKNYSSQKISVAVDGLNVRKDPSQDSKKLTVIYQNEKYPVLELNGDWVKIHIEDENLDGYVKSEFAELIVAFTDAVSKEEEQKVLQLQAEARAKEETKVKYGDGYSYTEDDLILLACLVHSEAGTQSYEGKLAVANIVLNRVKSSKYPDTIKAVIYQDGQFSVAASGSLEKQLNNFSNYNSNSQKLSIKAAKDALEGANNIGKRLYFHTYKAASKKGYTDNPDSVKLGDHLFW